MAKKKHKKRINTSTVDGRGRPPKDPKETKPHKYKKHRVSNKLDWTEEQLDKYYSRRGISERIRNTPTEGKKILSDTEVAEIYEKYNINRFDNKTEFRKYFKEHGLIDPKYDLTERENLLNRMWEEYKHRDELIKTGQYEIVRNDIFKKNYLLALESIGAPDYLVSALREASPEAWALMASTPNPNKNGTRDTLLPHLGEFAYSTKGDIADFDEQYVTSLITDIMKAMANAGIEFTIPKPYIYDNSVENEDGEIESREDYMRRIRRERRQSTLRKYRGAMRFLPKETIEAVESLADSEDIEETIADQFPILTQRGKKRFKIGKTGSIYVPFVGSQRSENTRDVINTLLNELDKRGVPRSAYIEGWEDL